MGGQISKLLSSFIWAKKEIRILILGLVSRMGPESAARPQLTLFFLLNRTTPERLRCYID